MDRDLMRSVFCWAYLEVFFLLAWRASCKDETFFVVLQRFFFFFGEIPWAWKATRKARKREIFLGRFFLG